MQRVQKAQIAVANQKQITAGIKAKLERLARHLRVPQCRRYRADRRFARAAAADADAAKAGRPATPASWNVLAEDYWDLYTLLLR